MNHDPLQKMRDTIAHHENTLKRIEQLESALLEILSVIPAHSSDSGFVIERCDPDGNYISTEYVDTTMIVMEIYNIAHLAHQIGKNPHGYVKMLENATIDAAIDFLKDKNRMDWLETQCVEVRTPLFHGSLAKFHAQQISDDCDSFKTDLRDQIDAEMKAKS